jgi:hypothetical protein
MRLYPSKAACCRSEHTAESAVAERRIRSRKYRGSYTAKRAKMIVHETGPVVDLGDGEFQVTERFWHWSDQDVSESFEPADLEPAGLVDEP